MDPRTPSSIPHALPSSSSTSRHTSTSEHTPISGPASPSKLPSPSGHPRLPTPPPNSPPRLRKKASTWLTSKTQKITSWLSTSEPSSVALTQHRKDSFARAGVSPQDPDPHTKLRAPIGDIPATAIRPATGPRPEEVLLKKAEERRKRGDAMKRRGAHGGGSSSEEGWSLYSGPGSVSGSSMKVGGFPYVGSSH